MHLGTISFKAQLLGLNNDVNPDSVAVFEKKVWARDFNHYNNKLNAKKQVNSRFYL